jgi:ribosomal protein S18 acetylase RimI-like enzyme
VAARTVFIRRLERDDFTAVVAIDERITGHPRHDYWRDRFETAESIRPPWASLVAELDGRVVGFLLGWSSGWEFGIRGSVGWIDVIGVDPPYRGRGVGRALVRAFAEGAQELRNIETIFTLVDSGDSQIREFFGRLGFTPGKMLHLERRGTVAEGDARKS